MPLTIRGGGRFCLAALLSSVWQQSPKYRYALFMGRGKRKRRRRRKRLLSSCYWQSFLDGCNLSLSHVLGRCQASRDVVPPNARKGWIKRHRTLHLLTGQPYAAETGLISWDRCADDCTFCQAPDTTPASRARKGGAPASENWTGLPAFPGVPGLRRGAAQSFQTNIDRHGWACWLPGMFHETKPRITNCGLETQCYVSVKIIYLFRHRLLGSDAARTHTRKTVNLDWLASRVLFCLA